MGSIWCDLHSDRPSLRDLSRPGPSSPASRCSAPPSDTRAGNAPHPAKENSMRIGIIGAGDMGATLAAQLTRLGHQVAIANSRGPQTPPFEQSVGSGQVGFPRSLPARSGLASLPY